MRTKLAAVFLVALVSLPLLSQPETEEFKKARSRGHTMACVSNVRNIVTALELYAAKNKGRYPDKLSELSPQYLRVLPTCPAAAKDVYSESYKAVNKKIEGKTGVSWRSRNSFCCAGNNHELAGVKPDHPAWNSAKGFDEGR